MFLIKDETKLYLYKKRQIIFPINSGKIIPKRIKDSSEIERKL